MLTPENERSMREGPVGCGRGFGRRGRYGSAGEPVGTSYIEGEACRRCSPLPLAGEGTGVRVTVRRSEAAILKA
jgi:hypothetical protein